MGTLGVWYTAGTQKIMGDHQPKLPAPLLYFSQDIITEKT